MRSDIDAAKAQMAFKLGRSRELQKLPKYVSDAEVVHNLAVGRYGEDRGLVVLTSSRLLFLKQGMFSETLEDFPIPTVSNVEWTSSIGVGTITIHSSGVTAAFTNLYKPDGESMLDQLRRLVATVQCGPGSFADELAKLADLHRAGVLSDEEFELRKSKLLND